MKRLLLVLLIALSGCSFFDHDSPGKPEPKPEPVESGIPAIQNGQLRVDGELVIAAGVYDLLVNADYYTPEKIDQVMKQYSDAGCNLFRVWVKTYFRPTDWQPWAWSANGLFDLSVPNENFYNRMRMIADKADKHGICIAWVLIDLWSVRQGFGYPPIWNQPDSLCPSRHIDPLAEDENRRMMTLNCYYENDNFDTPFQSGIKRAKRIVKCIYPDNDPLQDCVGEIGCRFHPAWWTMFERTTQIAKAHRDMIYVASEMSSGDATADAWNDHAMQEYTRRVVAYIHTIYPNCITGTSMGDMNRITYREVDIADIHGLGYGIFKDPERIAESDAYAKSSGINNIICYNSDGCQSEDRYNPDWIMRAIRNAWAVGGFFESKAESPAPIDAICEGFRRAK